MIATNYQRSTRAYGKHGGIMPIICSIVIDLAAIRYHVRIDIGCMRVWPSPEYVGGVAAYAIGPRLRWTVHIGLWECPMPIYQSMPIACRWGIGGGCTSS